MRVLWAAAALLMLSSTAHAGIGRLETKRERLAREAQNFGPSYTVAYEKIHESFLRDDYAGVVRLAHEYLSGSRNKPNRGDVRYLEALSLVKLGRGEEARAKLKELERDLDTAEDRAGAAISLADSHFHEGDLAAAASAYGDALRKYPQTEQKNYVTERLKELGDRQGRTLGPMVIVLDDEPKAAGPAAGGLFTVQVGSFANERNARALVYKLNRRKFDAYLEMDEADRMYRVRVGKVPSRQDALLLESRLKKEGYPTKIYP
jgi:tetratricopeptide (TPR) repeat protein